MKINCEYCGEEMESGIVNISNHVCKSVQPTFTGKEYFDLLFSKVEKIPQVLYVGESILKLYNEALQKDANKFTKDVKNKKSKTKRTN